MSYITTYTGVHFDPKCFKSEDICLEDIAHALSMLCRANGHMKHFYSVAQHSINCCYEAMTKDYSREVILGCLLHDASEAYMSDVTRPLKKDMTEYLKYEEILQNAIWEKLIGKALTNEDKKQIFEIDDCMLSYEFSILMREDYGNGKEKLESEPDTGFNDMELIEEEFKWLYNKIFGGEELC